MTLDDNLYIFNLCEKEDVPLKTILKIYKNFNVPISSNNIYEFLGNTPTGTKIEKYFENIDVSYHSLFCLMSCDISLYIIEMLKERFFSIEDMQNKEETLNEFHFQERTLNRIKNFLHDNIHLKASKYLDIESVILNELKNSNDAMPISNLFSSISCIKNGVSGNAVSEIINKLSKEGKIKTTAVGIEYKRPVLSQYIELHKNESIKFKMFELYMSGKTMRDLAKLYNVTQQNVSFNINILVDNLPLFDNEIKYKKIMSTYNLSYRIMERLGYGDKLLIKYVKFKYKFNPGKTDIDYVIDTNYAGQNLIGTDLGNSILAEHKLVFINNKLLKYEFLPLFYEFAEEEGIITFNINVVVEQFEKFLLKNNIDRNIIDKDTILIIRSLERTGVFLNCGYGNFYWINLENLSEEFLEKTKEFLNNFYGYCSSSVFLNKNIDLCAKEHITDKYQLFAVLKRLYSKEYENDIDFIRTPIFSTKGLSREDFFEGLISELQPITMNDFLNYVCDEYGFERASLYANHLSFFNKYIDSNGFLKLHLEPLDYSDKETQIVLGILDNEKVINLNEYLIKIKQALPNKYDYYSSKYTIKKFGYSYRNDSIYKKNYSSLYEAALSLSEDLPISISESKMLKYFPLSTLESRYSIIKQNSIFLKFSNDSYLNVNKRIDRESLLCFRESFIDSLVYDSIYILDDFLKTVTYRKLSDKFPEIAKMFQVLGYKLLINLLRGSPRITSLDSDEPFVFSTGIPISNKKIIKFLVNERVNIDRNELIDILINKYGINNDYNANFFFELGLYYNNYTNKIYISKEICEQELKDYLNMEGANDDLEKNR